MKLNKKQIKSALESLAGGAKLNPGKDWVEKNRDLLLSQIKNTVEAANEHFPLLDKLWETFSVLFSTKTVYSVVRPVTAVIVIIGMAGGGWASSVSAAQNSLPGDFLYNVKLAAEGAHLTIAQVTADNATVTTLRVERAARRIDEARQLVRMNGQNEAAARNIRKAVGSAKKEITALNDDLQKARKENATIVSAMAKVVEKEIDGIQEDIKGAAVEMKQAALGTVESKAEVEKSWRDMETLALVAEANAVEVMVENHLNGDAAISIEDVKRKVGENLDKSIEVIVRTPEIIMEDAKRAEQTVKEAKEMLKVQDLQGVLQKVEETKDLVSGAHEYANNADREKDGAKVSAPEIIVE